MLGLCCVCDACDTHNVQVVAPCSADVKLSHPANQSAMAVAAQLRRAAANVCLERENQCNASLMYLRVCAVLRCIDAHPGEAGVQAAACTALWVLASQHPKAHAPIIKIGNGRALRVLCSAIVSPHSSSVATSAVGALASLAEYDANALVSAGCVHALVHAMRSLPADWHIQALALQVWLYV